MLSFPLFYTSYIFLNTIIAFALSNFSYVNKLRSLSQESRLNH